MFMKEYLEKANSIVGLYEEHEKLSGDSFNLFTILDRETDEEKTHSAFIAELLDINGSHGQGDKFLNLFLELLSKKREMSAYWKNAKIPLLDEMHKTRVYVERNVGVYRSIGCYLDILLMNDRWQVLIENKFNAKQGKVQLERYLDYLKEDQSRETILIYLTKHGDKYNSTELIEGVDFFSLTYKDDIIEWLELCKEKCKHIATLEQSLLQYINLIKKETNQTVNHKMKNEIQELILKNGIKGAREIVNNYEKSLEIIIRELINKIKASLEEDLGKQNIRIQDDPFYSIFITIKDRKIGIEAFNIEKKSHRKNSLFIGEVDFKRKSEPKNLIHTYWIKKSIETIWSETDKRNKMNEFGKCEDKRDEIAQELVDYIRDYIKRITNN